MEFHFHLLLEKSVALRFHKKWNLIYSVPIWGWNWTSGSAAEDRAKKYGEGVGEGMLQITIFSKRGRRGEVAQPSYLCLNMPLWCKHLTTHRITHVKLKFAIICNNRTHVLYSSSCWSHYLGFTVFFKPIKDTSRQLCKVWYRDIGIKRLEQVIHDVLKL